MNKRHFSQSTQDTSVLRPLMIAQTYNWTLISNCLAGNICVCVLVSNYSGCFNLLFDERKDGNFGGNVINWRDLVPYQSRIKYRNYLQQTWENLAKFPAVFIRNLQWAMAQPLEDCSWVPQSVCRVRRWVWNLYARPHLRHCLRILPHWRANDCDGKETRMKGPASGGTRTRTRTKGRTRTGAMCHGMCSVPPTPVHIIFSCFITAWF